MRASDARERGNQRERTPRPRLAATVTGATVWKTTGVNSNESRTRFAPTPSRTDASSCQTSATFAITAPPSTQNGRARSSGAFCVSAPRAEKRPPSAEAQGHTSKTESLTRTGHASTLTASRKNEAVPPGASTLERHAWLSPRNTPGESGPHRSVLAEAYRATPGMTPGVGPAKAWPASENPKRLRLAAPEDGTLFGAGGVSVVFVRSAGGDSFGFRRGCVRDVPS